MNIWDQMKADIFEKYPKLPLWDRFVTFMDSRRQTENAVTIKNERGEFTQHYITTEWRGSILPVRFDRLFDN